MSHFDIHVTDRDRICKICNQPINRGEEGYVLTNVRVSGKTLNIHFHTECFLYQVDLITRGVEIRND